QQLQWVFFAPNYNERNRTPPVSPSNRNSTPSNSCSVGWKKCHWTVPHWIRENPCLFVAPVQSTRKKTGGSICHNRTYSRTRHADSRGSKEDNPLWRERSTMEG